MIELVPPPDAMRLGKMIYLNDAEAANASNTNAGNLDRPWELWKNRAESV